MKRTICCLLALALLLGLLPAMAESATSIRRGSFSVPIPDGMIKSVENDIRVVYARPDAGLFIDYQSLQTGELAPYRDFFNSQDVSVLLSLLLADLFSNPQEPVAVTLPCGVDCLMLEGDNAMGFHLRAYALKNGDDLLLVQFSGAADTLDAFSAPVMQGITVDGTDAALANASAEPTPAPDTQASTPDAGILGLIGALGTGTPAEESAPEVPAADDSAAMAEAEQWVGAINCSRRDLVFHLEDVGYSRDVAERVADAIDADWNQAAYKKAETYMSWSHYSHDKLVNQLEFEGFTTEQATYAADNYPADWRKNAVDEAQELLGYLHFSYRGLVRWLEQSEYVPYEDAVYAADNCGADWKQNAVLEAQENADRMKSRDDMIRYLEETEHFTHDEAVYGADNCGKSW